jgi:glycosyltransferase involved in cell wall biosynthesis
MMAGVIHASIDPEPFGMVVLEAMALRKPVIGSGAGGVIEMVVEGETGYTFPPGDSQVLASRVLALLGDPARAASMGEAGYRRVLDHFPLDAYVEAVQASYDEILDGASDPLPEGVAAGRGRKKLPGEPQFRNSGQPDRPRLDQ